MKRAMMWKIERLDGLVLGTTEHDQDIEYEDVIYHALGALRPSELEAEIGLGLPNMEVLGAVDNSVFKAEDFRNGLFLNARVSQWEYDFSKKEMARNVFVGEICEIEFSNNVFRAELRSPFDVINKVFGRSYTPHCQAIFGDDDCGIDRAQYSQVSHVDKIEGNKIWIELRDFEWPLTGGVVRFLDQGKKSGEILVRSSETINGFAVLTLAHAPKFQVNLGGKITVYAGCDKSLKCCKNDFQNAINFRGFPHMPGEEILNVNAEKQCQATAKNS